MRKRAFIVSIFYLSLIIHCSKPSEEPAHEIILVRIGDKSISVNEFIRRAEYAIRPGYCNGNTGIHKKIVLNSLIAEKLFALEAGADNKFISSERIAEQIRGRKEQAMRLVQFYREVYDNVKLDSSYINQYIARANRIYRIRYFNVDDAKTAATIHQKLATGQQTFDEAFTSLGHIADLPGREVSWSSNEHDLIIDSLFSAEIKSNQIIGPLKFASNQYMFIDVVDWSVKPVITKKDITDQWEQVSKRLKEKRAKVKYDEYIHNIMRGKLLEFSPATFRKLANILGPYYFTSSENKKELAEKASIEQHGTDLSYEHFHEDLVAIADEALLKIDGNVWTIERFMKEMNAHPLVFRQKKMKTSDFGKQLQLAIGDLVRDKYLTQEAYKKGYDKLPGVIRDVNMWQDNQSYYFQKHNYIQSLKLDSTIVKNPFKIIDLYLNSYVDSLQAKYSDIIEINMDAFDKIRLTRIDMSVIQQNVPYAKPVPGFPLVTTDFRLSYGRKMAP